ncbi:MAG: DUF5309 family protein [Halanaerobiales bacterium]
MPIDFNGRNIWSGSNGSPVTTLNIDTDRRDIDISNEISYLFPDATPFLTILMRARKVPVDSAEFIWYDEGAPSWYSRIDNGAGYSDSDTEIVLDDSSIFRPKDIIKNTKTGEVMFVSSVEHSTNTLTVIRGYGQDTDAGTGTAPAAMDDNDYILRLSNAMEERSSSPESYITQPEKYFNFVQTIRTPFDGSFDSEHEKKTAGGSERLRIRRQKLIEHRVDIEKTAIWGERKEDLSSGKPVRTTGGIVQYITSNSYDVGSANGGTLTEAELENICEVAFRYNSTEGAPKVLVTSRIVGGIINQFAAGRIETTSGEETYGMRLKKYVSFHGDLIIIPSRLFENDYAGTGLILDIPNIDYRPFAGKDSTLKTNIQLPDVDGWKDEYMTKFGMRIRNQETHTVITGVES